MVSINEKIYPVILSGGSGRRLWPLSRALYPKQFQSINSNLSLLQETINRTRGPNFSNPIIICNQNHRFIVAEQLKAINIDARSIILEPIGRNTAPAAAVASFIMSQGNPDAYALLLPSDHIISNNDIFEETIRKALPAARQGNFVTFGITPTRAETGYGYIKKGIQLSDRQNTFEVEKFVEKPNNSDAQTFLKSSNYLWNAGIFLFSAKKYLSVLEELHPDIFTACQKALSNSENDLVFQRLNNDDFSSCPAMSIDYAIMEKSDEVVTIPVEMGWSDIGSWKSLWEILEKDKDGNVIIGDVIVHKTRNSLIHSQDKLTTSIGIENAIVISTDDANLILDKDMAQDVNLVVEKLADSGRKEEITHTRTYRPWGWFRVIETKDNFQVKIINLKPGSKISLQRHKYRAEHWVVVKGTARVRRDDEIIYLNENESTYIPVGMIHRLENNSKDTLEIIEVQSGSYLGEDDIERFEDDYGRD